METGIHAEERLFAEFLMCWRVRAGERVAHVLAHINTGVGMARIPIRASVQVPRVLVGGVNCPGQEVMKGY